MRREKISDRDCQNVEQVKTFKYLKYKIAKINSDVN